MAKLKGWKPEHWEGDVIRKRNYKDWDEYEENQRAAYLKRKKAIIRFTYDVKRFYKRFSEIPDLKGKKALCLGVRTGAEVLAFRQLGCEALGVDIEPITNATTKAYVTKGDFHHMPQYDTKEFDVVYTNSFDHVYDLDKVLDEVKRVLKDDGTFILEMVAGYGEGGCPGDHEAMYWRTAHDFTNEVEKHGFKRMHRLQDVPFVKGQAHKRAMLKKV